MKILNKTLYYDEKVTKDTFEVADSDSSVFQLQRQKGYEQRLTFEYEYCKKLGGKVFMYTLTFNDNSLFRFLGYPVHDYRKFRQMCEYDGFRKELVNFGYDMKYFLACELGEGKGKRGYNNNPHFHVVFFLYPNASHRCVITPFQFRYMIRKYWCFYHFKDKEYLWRRLRFKQYRYGKCDPCSLNCGEVIKLDALRYVVKYVVKDVTKNKQFKKIARSIYLLYSNPNLIYSLSFRMWFYDRNQEYINGLLCSRHEYVSQSYILRRPYIDIVIDKKILEHDKFLLSEYEVWHDEQVKNMFRAYNRYFKPKVRVSQGIGLSCVSSITDEGLLKVSDKKQIKFETPNFYAYRKKYYNTKKMFNGNNRYTINETGIELRMSKFKTFLYDYFNTISTFIDMLREDVNLYNDFISSCEVEPCDLSLFDNELLTKYVLYKKIYEGRYYDIRNVPEICLTSFDDISHSSYMYDVLLSAESNEKSSLTPWSIHKNSIDRHFTSFTFFPPFFAVSGLFAWLDCLVDYVRGVRDSALAKRLDQKDKTRKSVNNKNYD